MRTVQDVYSRLYEVYGPQGWWPLLTTESEDRRVSAPEKAECYHPGDYTYPRNEQQRFEICVGAILTQNTAWDNVHRALVTLYKKGALSVEGIGELSDDELKNSIRPSGYYNMKASKLRAFIPFFRGLLPGQIPERDELLGVWGIGPETADSMLLYAFSQPHMVVDAYTRRILAALGFIKSNERYENIKALCEEQLAPDIIVYQELHALLVEHAKNYYTRQSPEDPVLMR